LSRTGVRFATELISTLFTHTPLRKAVTGNFRLAIIYAHFVSQKDSNMAIRPIVKADNPILRQKAHRVREFDSKLHTLLDDLRETMLAAPGSGMAAPQVGVSQRAIIVQFPEDEEEGVELHPDEAGQVYEMINPEIVKTTRDMEDGVEGCLSIPGYYGHVQRHTGVTVRGQDRHGKEIRIKARGWLARIFQHEVDHLNGVLFVDRATEVWKAKPQTQPVEGETPQRALGK